MVNIVVVGCGAVLEQLYRIPLKELESHGWGRIRAVVDPLEERRVAALSWFKGPKAFSELTAAFGAIEKVDLTIVASPPAFHASQVVAALEHGSHVLCEKPIAHTISAAEQMVGVAKKRNRILAIGMVRRFYPSIASAREFVREDACGSDLTFTFREGSVFNWPLASPAQFRRQTGGGGVLIDKGVHALDTLYHVFGPGRVLKSADDAQRENSVESNAMLELQFGYARGTLHTSWDTVLNNGFHIARPAGELWLPLSPIDTVWKRGATNASQWVRLKAESGWPNSLDERRPKVCVPRDVFECVRLQLISVLRSVLLGERSVATGEEGLEVLRLLLTAYDEAIPLKKPWLPRSEQLANASQHWKSSELRT